MKKYQLTLMLLVLLSVSVLSTNGICTKHATDGTLSDWGLNALKNNASWGVNSTWLPNAGIQFIVKDNYNPKAALYSNYPAGVHIRGTGSSYSFFDDPQVMHRDGYPVWEPYGGEHYNLEAFYFDQDSNCIYVTVITSEPPTAQGDAAPGDLALNADNNPNTGKFGYEYGVKLESYHTRNNPLNLLGLYSNPDWQIPPYIPQNRPSYFKNGTYIGQVKGVYTELKDDNGNGVYDAGDSYGNAYPNYIIQLAIPKDEVGNPTNLSFDSFYFSEYCGNDHIAGLEITQVLDHFELSIIPSPQTAGVPFSVTITAKDSANNTVLSYNGHATLSDLTGTLSPTTTGNFVDGVWSGKITITKAYNATRINAQDTGKSGISNNFDVIAGPVAKLNIAPHAVTLNIGQSQQFTAECQDSYGNLASCPSLNWSTNLGGYITTSGFFTAPTSPAYGLVEAENGSLHDSSNVTVIRRSAVSLEVVCIPSTIQLYDNSTCTATAKDMDNNSWDATANSTFSTNDLQGNITGNIYTAGALGNWSVNATYDGVAGSTVVTVEAPEVSQLARIVISPTGPVHLAVGDNLTFSASCYDTEDNSMLCPALNWNSSNDSVASVNSGIANALTPGASGITAQNGEVISNTVDITVSQNEEGPEMLIITCESPAISAGTVLTCTAQLNDSGVISDVTNSTNFSSSGGSMQGNNFTANIAGNYTITGTYGSLNGSFQITVTHGVASSLSITCSPQTITAGAATTCTATANDTYNNSWNATAGTSFSIQPAAGGSWNGNVYTSQNAGSWIITGSYSELSGTTTITVNPTEQPIPPQPPAPPYIPPSNGGGSATLGCAYNDPPCTAGYKCVSNKCVPLQPPEQQPSSNNSTSQQTGAGKVLDIHAPENGFRGDIIRIRVVIAGTDISVPSTPVEVITPTNERLSLLTNEIGEATYPALEVGVYQYVISNPLAKNRVTYITERPIEKQQNLPQNNTVTIQQLATPPSIAQVLLANAPLWAGLVILLAVLLFALITRRRKKKEEEKKEVDTNG